MRPAKLVVVIPLLVIAAFFAWYAGFIISNVFADYKDSPDATYLKIGGACLVISALFAAVALLAVSPTRPRWGWLVLAVLALLASALPYTAMIGWVGYGVHAILVLLAFGSVLAYLMRTRPASSSEGT
jgi:hypothetical protein